MIDYLNADADTWSDTMSIIAQETGLEPCLDNIDRINRILLLKYEQQNHQEVKGFKTIEEWKAEGFELKLPYSEMYEYSLWQLHYVAKKPKHINALNWWDYDYFLKIVEVFSPQDVGPA